MSTDIPVIRVKPARAVVVADEDLVLGNPGGFLDRVRPQLLSTFAEQGIENPRIAYGEIRTEGTVQIDGEEVDLAEQGLIAFNAVGVPQGTKVDDGFTGFLSLDAPTAPGGATGRGARRRLFRRAV
jgi:hypothetical protein